MLRRGLRYEAARARYAPFDRLRDRDPETRSQLARLAAGFAARGRPATIAVNNKAEGSAPRSVFALAEAVAAALPAAAAAGREAEPATAGGAGAETARGTGEAPAHGTGEAPACGTGEAPVRGAGERTPRAPKRSSTAS
jgi:hypothetical protein